VAFVFKNRKAFYFMKKKNQTLLWQLNTEGSLTTHFLIGTMHSKDNRVFKHILKNYDAIKKCDIFATEFPLDDAEHFDIQKYMMLPEAETLSTVLTPKLYEKTILLFKKKLKIDLAQFERFSPFFLTNMLSDNALNADNFHTLDESMWQFAKNEGKILRGIETFDEQLEILQKMTFADHIKGLKDIVSKHDKFRKKLQKMIKLYENQDISALYQLAKRTTQANRKLLLFDRNELMTKRIITLSKQNSLCVAVGAGHLSGKKGILNLMKKEGFIVKPVY
jgi:uncharacterized protein